MKYECPDCGDEFANINNVNGYCMNCREHFNLEDVERRQALAQTASESAGDVMADPAFFDTREAYLQNQVETLTMDVKLAGEEIERLNAKIERALGVPMLKLYPQGDSLEDSYEKNGYNAAIRDIRKLLTATDDSAQS